MNKKNYIFITLLIGCSVSTHAQQSEAVSEKQLSDTLSIGYQVNTNMKQSSYSITGVNSDVFDKSPSVDISKALYGKIAGLNIYQGVGSSSENISGITLHGNTPLILIDGFPRNINDVTSLEIESCYLLKDAAATALYGMSGANGVLLINTKRGTNAKLKIRAEYNFGVNSQFRSPDFADAYTYANAVNTALSGDGLAQRYNSQELNAFQTGIHPSEYPNVNWWDQALNETSLSHNLKLSFNGGNDKFRYFTVIDYYRDRSMFKENTTDDRYDTKPTDTRLSLRTNIDVDITETTYFKVGLVGKLMEVNGSRSGDYTLMRSLYSTPSAAFPIRYSNGIYGGSSVYGASNPVALLKDNGHLRRVAGTLLADLNLRQNLDALIEGLSADVSISFDNTGVMSENSSKEYRYMNSSAQITDDGTLVTTPIIFGKDSETLGHSMPFEGLLMRSDFQAKMAYERTFEKHQVNAALIYDMQSAILNGRNRSRKNQSFIANAHYTYDNRYVINGVINYSGSAYLPDGDKFRVYPAVSAAWIISNENFMKDFSLFNQLKLRASYGLSGWDGNLDHELWRQAYGGSGTTYYFGNNTTGVGGGSEGALPVIGLTTERSEKMTLGLDLGLLDNRFNASIDGFYEERSDVLVSGSNSTSGIIGVGVGLLNEGVYEYKGVDASLNWNDKIADFGYGIGVNVSYLDSKIINDNQAFQEHDYLYHKGNRLGQSYGLESVGFFSNDMDINNSPRQTFSQVAPGDIKYKDQNGDNIIDEKDVVKMFGSSIPRFYFGLDLNFSYKQFELSADLQGITGKTVSLLNSPLYNPLVNNGNISDTFLDEEIYWTPESKENATMPRLTTLDNKNNYRSSSLWYRDASFLKLRNLLISYTLPKSQTSFADIKVFVQGTNLFSLDNIKFADPEQLNMNYPSIRSYWAGIKFNF